MNEIKSEQLKRIVIKGYKSIKDCDLELKNINVLIGSNGAGKSNFISVFELLQSILEKELSYYAEKKGVNTLFYNGLKTTNSIKLKTYYKWYSHSCEIELSENNTPIIRDERMSVENGSFFAPPSDAYEKHTWRIYHFHDTSPSARIKSEHNISNCAVLMQDARNLAAFLYRLRERYSAQYQKIIKTVQRIAPYFKDFILEPNEHNSEHIVLQWQQKGCEDIFNASQLSDGTLRFICLATLLLQPENLQPATIIIDEPELGLHPYAITIFAELVKKSAVKKQLILATQSVELLDHFEPNDVIVVDRKSGGSEFKRLETEQLAAWLDDYTLGELWNKNIFGGRVLR